MDKIQCDRCKRVVNKNDYQVIQFFTGVREGTPQFDLCNPTLQFDLCNKCNKEAKKLLKVFIGNNNYY